MAKRKRRPTSINGVNMTCPWPTDFDFSQLGTHAWEYITPERAKKDLQAVDEAAKENPDLANFRPAKTNKIDNFVEDMKSVDWDPNGETVKYDRDGILMDGQHRLKSCVRSGVGFPCLVVREVPREFESSMDQNMVRKLRDNLRKNGYKHHNLLAQVVSGVFIYRNGFWKTDSHNKGTVTDKQMVELLERRTPFYEQCAELASYIPKSTIPPSMIGTLAAIACDELGEIGEQMDEFVSLFVDECGPKWNTNSPVKRLISWIRKQRNIGERLPTRTARKHLTTAWNAFVAGEGLSKDFPVEKKPKDEDKAKLKAKQAKEADSFIIEKATK